jgi:hypothetical protein
VQFVVALLALLLPCVASAQIMLGQTVSGRECTVAMKQDETLGPPGEDNLVVTVQPRANTLLRLMHGTDPTSLTNEVAPEICANDGTCAAPGVVNTVLADELAAFKILAVAKGTKHYYQVQCRQNAADNWTPRPTYFAWTMPDAGTTYEVYGWGDEQNQMAWDCNYSPSSGTQDASYARSRGMVLDWAQDTSNPAFFLSLGDTFMLNGCNSWFCTGGAGSRSPCQYQGTDMAAGRINAVTTTCCVFDDTGGANAAGNAARGELAMLSMLRTFAPLPSILPTMWVPGNHDLDFPMEQKTAGVYAEGHQAAANDAKLSVLFNPQETDFYPGVGFNDQLGREYCNEMGDALWCQIRPYTCTCSTDCEPGDADSNLPQTPSDWAHCSNSVTAINTAIDAFAGKYVFIVAHQGAWGVNGIENRDWTYGRGNSLAVERRCIVTTTEANADDGTFQCQHNEVGGALDCEGNFGDGHHCTEINPTGDFNNSAGQTFQGMLEDAITDGREWVFVLTGHEHSDFVNCKLNSSGVCSKVVYVTLGMPSRTSQSNVTWPWLDNKFSNEYFDGDRDGQQDAITFYLQGHTDDDVTGKAPHGVYNASNVAGAWKILVGPNDVTLEKWSNDLGFDDVTGTTVAPQSKIIDLTYSTSFTPLSVSLSCADSGSGTSIDCTATPSNNVGTVEYLWDCDGDWSFTDEPGAVRGSRDFGWRTENTMTCPSDTVGSGSNTINVIAEETTVQFMATDNATVVLP